MALQLFNTLSRKKESFVSLDPKLIRLYTCGPTVYNFAHIGNFRAYIVADLLKRALLWRTFSVSHTMNITDVDDKMITNSQKEFPDMEPMEALLTFGKKYRKRTKRRRRKPVHYTFSRKNTRIR